MKNSGKIFEEDFKKSIPQKCLTIRLPDPPQSFTKRSDTRFSIKNPCDFIIFYTNKGILFPMELKTTKYKSMSFEDVNSNNEEQNRMIHKHQIIGLTKFSEYEKVIAGFLFNFRDEEKQLQRTYYQTIDGFNKMTSHINKKSFNEIDLLLYDGIKVIGQKKRTRYLWDIDNLLNKLCE